MTNMQAFVAVGLLRGIAICSFVAALWCFWTAVKLITKRRKPRTPWDVLQEQSVISWRMHEETGAPRIGVPKPGSEPGK